MAKRYQTMPFNLGLPDYVNQIWYVSGFDEALRHVTCSKEARIQPTH